MAEIRVAVDETLDRRVVVKLLAQGGDLTRFEREARAVAALAHPNIVQLFDFGEEERRYMVFEYLSGGSLEERFSREVAFSDDDVARIATDVAAGLAHAHEHGVVHRDLKPGNILFDSEGRAKVADFGIARVADADTLTDTGTVLGTAAYISPEQVRGEPVTPATDVYSFGVVVYRLLAGHLPFEAATPIELARMHRDQEPTPLPTVGARNATLAAVAMSALAKDPARRPSDGAALLGALDQGRVPDTATTLVGAPPPQRHGRRRPLIAAFAAVLIAAAGVLAAILLTGGQTSAPAVPVPSSHGSTTTGPRTHGATQTASSVSSTEATSTPERTNITRPSSTQGVTTATLPTPPPATEVTTATVPSTALTTPTAP